MYLHKCTSDTDKHVADQINKSVVSTQKNLGVMVAAAWLLSFGTTMSDGLPAFNIPSILRFHRRRRPVRLLGMVDALKLQERDPTSRELSFLEKLGRLGLPLSEKQIPQVVEILKKWRQI
jgi:hypothetical protein